MTSFTFSIVPHLDRWAVSCGGEELVSANSPEEALESALDAVTILRKSGWKARVTPTVMAERRSFAPDE